MMNKVYTVGYQQLKDGPQQLKKLAETLGAIVVDIRLNPFSRIPGWNRDPLKREIGSQLYKDVPEFGNVNYKSGSSIKIAWPDRGLQVILPILNQQPVILLCACRNVETCHRKVVAQLIADELNVEIEHLEPKLERADVGMKAISLKQPWAWLMVNGYKDIENRKWSTSFRGPVLVHASKTWDEETFPLTYGKNLLRVSDLPTFIPPQTRMALPTYVSSYQTGGIVGMFTITDCVTQSESSWFFGPYGFVVKDAFTLPFVSLRGQLGFFDVPDEVVERLGLIEKAGR